MPPISNVIKKREKICTRRGDSAKTLGNKEKKLNKRYHRLGKSVVWKTTSVPKEIKTELRRQSR